MKLTTIEVECKINEKEVSKQVDRLSKKLKKAEKILNSIKNTEINLNVTTGKKKKWWQVFR